MRGKLLAKGRQGRSDEELRELCEAWRPFGVHIDPDEFQEAENPALYLFYKLLMVRPMLEREISRKKDWRRTRSGER